jgi:hypothetical protein
MARSNRRHIDQLSFEQFDPVVLAEDAGLTQPMIVFHREPVPGRGTG